MERSFEFDRVCRLPHPGDNVAIAIHRLEAGTAVDHGGQQVTLDSTVLEGHRFAVRPIANGESLLSWGLPFGVALRDIAPGEYVCNPQMLDALKLRDLSAVLPTEPNFEDRIVRHDLAPDLFTDGMQVSPIPNAPTFRGYRRPGSRGVGTRNCIVIIATTSRTASYAIQLENQLKTVSGAYRNVDGIVAVAHTEGGAAERPNNLGLLLRSLAGLIVHPNVGAALVVDHGTESLTNRMLEDHMRREGYPLDDVACWFLSLQGAFHHSLDAGDAIIRGWLDTVDRTARTEASAAHLKIALQCGGSDAFSGISGNPLVALVARDIVRYGGSANLAETPELIGAESYVLGNVKDLDTADRFLDTIQRYKELAARHGTTAEGNPSGGNKLRGLYNITLKSIGAALKRHPEVRLDDVIEYGAPMDYPGFYFMDSPGNDPESVAGQVASGCNLVFFVTGNGSVTNFPFVPTIKVMTTSRRYDLLTGEMDVNAGAYLDGTPMEQLARETLELALKVASGERTKGERAGHSQVSFWRDWGDTGTRRPLILDAPPQRCGKPIPIRAETVGGKLSFRAIRKANGHAVDQVGLIFPASLCSSQVARMGAERFTREGLGREQGISRFVALVHTEGCGMAGDSAERVYANTMLSYLTHPLVDGCALLEHGCENTHNDYIRRNLKTLEVDPESFGWASIQLDGGIDNALRKLEDWFAARLSHRGVPEYEEADLSALCVGLLTAGPVEENEAGGLAGLTRTLVGAGGTVVLPQNDGLLDSPAFQTQTFGSGRLEPSLTYAQPARSPGFHVMETPTDHLVETFTGLGATGAQVLVACAGEHPVQGHLLVPTLLVGGTAPVRERFGGDLDCVLGQTPPENAKDLLLRVLAVASRDYVPKSRRHGNTDFQLPRSWMGVSM